MIEAACWDPRLYHNYQSFGGLYVSYPCPNEFHTSISAFERYSAIRASSNRQCTLNIKLNFPDIAEAALRECYVEALQQEIHQLARLANQCAPIQQLYFSGHTHRYSPVQLASIMNSLRNELSVESHMLYNYRIDIDPYQMSWSDIGAIRDMGFNRTTFNLPEKSCDFRQIQTVYEAARTLQFCSISFSIPYGYPEQSLSDAELQLKKTIVLTPERITLRMHAEAEANPLLPKLLQQAIESFAAAGYGYVGMDCFALPDDDLIAAQEMGLLACNTHTQCSYAGCDILGFGTHAVSQIGSLAYQNTNDLQGYISSLEHQQLPEANGTLCSTDDLIRREIIYSLLLQGHISFAMLEQQFSIQFKHYFTDIYTQLLHMQNDGLIHMDEQQLRMTPQGFLLANAVCKLFDRYHTPRAIDQHLYSPTL